MLNYNLKRRLVNYHILSRRVRLTTEEGYDFAFAPIAILQAPACWKYDNTRHRHNLLLSNELDEIADRPALKRLDIRSFTERVYDHEGAHSLFTNRDNPRLSALQKKWKVPFHLWNLFEDSRIEACWRRRFGRRFNWLRYALLTDEKPSVPTYPPEPSNAIGLYLDCTHLENSPLKLKTWQDADKDPKMQFESKGKPRYGRRYLVKYYYRKAIRVRTTEGLLPLIASWIKTFPETGAGMGEPGEGEGAGRLVKGIHATDMGDPSKAGEPGAGEMPKGAEDADGTEHKEIAETIKPKSGTGSEVSVDRSTGTTAQKEKDEKYHHESASKKLVVPRNCYFSSSPTRTMDWNRANSLIRLFEKFLEGGEGMVTSRNPTNKIDFGKFMRGADDFYKRKGNDPMGVKKISFIMDCSGSMSRASEDGVYLAYVLNELVKRRKIECPNMILSGGSNFVVPMPFDPRLLDCLQTPGGHEGFANTMREHEKQLVDSNMTIFFTDGNITDEHIVKADWHRKGVYTVGLFVGDPSRSASLHRWFDSVLVRNDIEAVADSLIQLMKRQ